MSNTLTVRLTTTKTTTGDVYEGTVSIANLRPTKLVRKTDGTTRFPTRGAVCGSARNVAKALGYSDVTFVEPNQPQAKAAAKKVAKKVAKKTSPAPQTASAASANPEAQRR